MNNKLHTIFRVLFGALFLCFGINYFHEFIPQPSMDLEAKAFLTALGLTGYFMEMVKIIEVLSGSLLILNIFAPFALVMITPILVGITSMHIFLNPQGVPIMIAIHVLHALVAFGYRKYYTGLTTLFARSD